MDRNRLEEFAKQLVDSAIEVHRELGPGLLESSYEMALCRELSLRGIHFERQRAMPVAYKGVSLDCGYRADVIIAGELLVEIKAVDELTPVHEAQVFTYLKLGGMHLGFLINFNTRLLKHGLKRIVYQHPESGTAGQVSLR